LGAGATVSDVLNDLERAQGGRLMLPNLVVGMPIPVVLRLVVPERAASADLLTVRLDWEDPGGGRRRVLHARLGALPSLPLDSWKKVPVDPAVHEQVALLLAARAQKEAVRAQQRNDLAGARNWLEWARLTLSGVTGSAACAEALRAVAKITMAL